MRKFILTNGMFMLGMYLASLFFEEDINLAQRPKEVDMGSAVECLIDSEAVNRNCSNNPLEFINTMEAF